MEVFDLPLGFPSGWVATQVATDFFDKYKPEEWKDVHILFLSTSGPLILESVAKPVKTMEDMKGMKIRAVGVMSDVIKALGGLPVPLQMPDVYDALRRNVIDGVTVDLSTLKFWKFAEVVKCLQRIGSSGPGILSTGSSTSANGTPCRLTFRRLSLRWPPKPGRNRADCGMTWILREETCSRAWAVR
jgi:hypothetical protein